MNWMLEVCYIADMNNDDKIIEARIAGRSVRAIAKAQGCSVAEVNRVIDFWADQTITGRIRKHTLTVELARLDELQQVLRLRAPSNVARW